MRVVYLLLLGAAILGCKPKTFNVGQANLDNFKKDRGGCEDFRVKEIEHLKVAKDSLLSHSENEVLATLGRYDFQILDTKNQKVFVYYLEKGPQCENIQNETSATSMAVYFNAVSLVKEVTFQKGMP